MAFDGTNYSSQAHQQPEQLQYIFFNMYMDKYDRMRVVDFAKQAISESLQNKTIPCPRELLWKIIYKINFVGIHDFLERQLLIENLLHLYNFYGVTSTNGLCDRLNHLLSQFELVNGEYLFSVCLVRPQPIFQPPPTQQYHTEPQTSSDVEQTKSDDVFGEASATEQIPEEPTPESNCDACRNDELFASVEDTQEEQVEGEEDTPNVLPNASDSAMSFEIGHWNQSDSVETHQVEMRSVGVQCDDSSATLGFGACLKLTWASFKRLVRKALSKLMFWKSRASANFDDRAIASTCSRLSL